MSDLRLGGGSRRITYVEANTGQRNTQLTLYFRRGRNRSEHYAKSSLKDMAEIQFTEEVLNIWMSSN